jgi:LuxR family maltose regulon positive regulatory protein
VGILKTRLYKPPVSERFIFRERLTDRLTAEADRPLILIVAGAGYGKSILMSQWLETRRENYCWISLAEDCNELQLFLAYLVAAVQEKFPESLQKMAQVIDSNPLPADELLAQTLLNELQELPGPLTLVFDDFHKIRNRSIFNLLDQLLSFPPEQVRFALIARRDPPIKKARLQAYHQICEIRMADLRLGSDEIMELAKRSVAKVLSADTARTLEETTEGWILGVNLALQDYKNNLSPQQSDQLNPEDSESLHQYLFELFEERLPPVDLKLLMAASLFERFDFGLMSRLFQDPPTSGFGKEDLRERFLDMQRSDDSLLLIGLDEKNQWYRLHHLVQDMLKKRLVQTVSKGDIDAYYQTAGRYFADSGFPDEGLSYYLLGANAEKAVEIIVSNWERLIDYGQMLRLNRWLNQLPAGLAENHPGLLVMKAFLCDTFADFEAMGRYLDQAKVLINEQDTDTGLQGALASVHSCYCCYTGDIPGALAYATQALELLPEQTFLFDYALNFKVLSLNMMQRGEEARSLIQAVRSGLDPKQRRKLMRINVIQFLSDPYQARTRDLKYLAQTVVDICEEEKVWWMYKMGQYYLGQYYYMKNRIREVYPQLEKGINCFFNAGPVWALHLYYTGAHAALAEQDLSKMEQYLEEARAFIEVNKLPSFRGYLQAFEVEMALRTHDLEKAWALNRTATYDLHPPLYYYYIPRLTPIKLYLRKGDADLMREAESLIRQYKTEARETGDIHTGIQVTLLEALWLQASGLQQKAIRALREALALVSEDEYIRVFLDLGSPIQKLLQALSESEKQTPLVRNVLDAFRYEQELTDTRSVLPDETALTEKEQAIMALVAEGLLNKEIASRLYLSESTIKTYLYRIYQKLGVNNRYAATRKLNRIQSF